jgi:hypothetical protein
MPMHAIIFLGHKSFDKMEENLFWVTWEKIKAADTGLIF